MLFRSPTIIKECEYFDRTMFHADGPGFIKHMDDLLATENLDGIQWIPGAGSPKVNEWPDLYEKINKSDKLLQVFIEEEEELPFIDEILQYFDNPGRVCFICTGEAKDRDRFEEYIKKYKSN